MELKFQPISYKSLVRGKVDIKCMVMKACKIKDIKQKENIKMQL